MLSTARDRVLKSKLSGKSLPECIADKPLADLEPAWDKGILNDNMFGLIKWKQMAVFGRSAFVDFTNPDIVRYAESFGAKVYRIEKASELVPALTAALAWNTLAVIDCPIDFSENLKLTEALGALVCPT